MWCSQITETKNYGIAEWKEDLKSVLMDAALHEKTTVFLFSDTQASIDGAFEDLNAILNSGDVPNLFGPEEMEQINATCRRDCITRRIAPTRINVFAQVSG